MTDRLACPNVLTLHRLMRGELADADAVSLEGHIEGCEHCGQALERLLGQDSILRVLRLQATDPNSSSTEVEDLIRRLKELPAAKHTPFPGGANLAEAPTVTSNPTPLLAPTWEVQDLLAPAQGPNELGRLGTYRILKVLGAGGMGVVFEAEDVQLQRPVALKVIHPARATSAEARERFLREARAMAALEHDHIVPVYQVGEDRSVLFLAMPLLKGEMLEERLSRCGRLPVAEILRIGRETAEGLAAAHAQGLVHRDIKPANLWLEGERGRVKIVDFGLARAATDDAQITQQGAIVGTPAYMAPEQVNGHVPDARGDLFSLGCVLYRLATGEPAFRGADTIATLMAVATEQPRPPRELNPELPPALAELITQLLAKQPAARPSSAQAVAAALQAIVPGETALPDSALVARADTARDSTTEILPRRTRAFTRRRFLALMAVVSVVLLAIAGYLFGPAVYRFVRETTNKKGAGPELVAADRAPPAVPEPGGLLRVLRGHVGPVGPVVCSADGHRALSGSWDGTMRLWDLDSGVELHRFDGHTGWVWSVAFSPDARWALSAGSFDRSVRCWDLGTCKDVYQLRRRAERFLGVAFGPEGACAVSDGGDDDNTLRVWNVETRQERFRLPGHTQRVERVAFSPDGRWLLSGSRDGTVRLWDLTTRAAVRKLEGHQGPVLGVALTPDGHRALSGSEDGTVRLWDLDTGHELCRLPGQVAAVEAIAFGPDGHRALTGGRDGALRLWDLDSGKQLTVLESESGLIGGVTFTPDGGRALSGGADGSLRLWRLPP
jgi:serine/threonine protein kinase/WD40 repeat protein